MKSIFFVLVSVFSFSAMAQGTNAAAAPAPVAPPPPAYQNESQVAVVQTSGNTTTESLSLKQLSTYTKDKDTGKVAGSYLKTSTDSVDTALKWDIGARYERLLSDKFSGYIGYSVESDRFANFIQRNNADLGGKYQIRKTEKYDLLSELGYRYTIEDRVNEISDDYYSSVRLYLEGVYRINATNSAKLWVEYLPNLDETENYKINSEASLSSAINTMFSLKVAYLVNYNNGQIKDPATGIRPDYTDTTLTTALVAKF